MITLVQFEDVSNYLGLARSESSHPQLAIIAPSVTTAIENYIGRKLESEERTEVIHIGSSETRFIDLKALPVTEVVSVVVTELGEDETLVENEDFIVSNGGIELLYTRLKRCKVTVVYTGGYVEDDVPEDFHRAALLQTIHEYQTKDHVGADSVSSEGGSIQRPGVVLLPEVKRLLDEHKHPARIV